MIDVRAFIRESISDGLDQAGYETQSAPDGRAGLKQVSSFRPNAIVTDVMMPDMEGIEFLREVRAQFLKAALLMGASATLRKPFTVDALVTELERVCGT